jgi:hypothetical protein
LVQAASGFPQVDGKRLSTFSKTDIRMGRYDLACADGEAEAAGKIDFVSGSVNRAATLF